MVYEFNANDYIYTLTYNQSVNELPTAAITLVDTSIDYPGFKFLLNFNVAKLSTSVLPQPTNIFYQNHNYDITARSWNGLLSLSLMYARDLTFTPYVNPNNPTQTLCKASLTSVYNYFLALYPCFSSLFHTSPFSHAGVVFRFEPHNMSFLDFLNYLTNFGFYWFVDFMYSNYHLPVLRIHHITQTPINKGTILGGESITIDTEHPNYKSVKLIKEPYDDNIPREMVITGENPCIILNFGVQPGGISILEINTAGYPVNLGLMMFNENGTRWWHAPTPAPDIGDCYVRTITDCNNEYAHKFVPAGTCQGSNIYGDVEYCGAYKVGGEGAGARILPGQATGSNCIYQIKMIAEGCTFDNNFPPNAYIRFSINPSALCNVDTSCIITNPSDYEFDKSLKTHTITTTIPNTCNSAPYEITFQNINQTLWELVIAYYTYISTRPRRIIRITNPICETPLQVGYYYNVRLGNTTLTNCRLLSISINSDNQKWGMEIELERYDT